MKSELSLYIHIPFCPRKCLYCDFLSGTASPREVDEYLTALCEEIKRAGEIFGIGSGTMVDTIFVGGGTPTVLTSKQMDYLMTALSMNFEIRDDAEITTECNPGTVDREKLLSLRCMGFNRLSIGVQSFRDEELKALGRIHTAAEARKTIEGAYEAGFTNLSVDLMSAIPGQTLSSLEENLRTVIDAGIPHVSVYSLIVEEETPYGIRYGEDGTEGVDGDLLNRLKGLPDLPDEDTEREMVYRTKEILEGGGLYRYEISNFAKKGYESLHNTGYWREHPYLGLGVSAASLVFTGEGKKDGIRFSNTRSLSEYKKAMLQEGDLTKIRREEKVRTRQDAMEEFMFLGLRMTDGVLEDEFLRRFGGSIESVYGSIPEEQKRKGLLQEEEGRLFLTERGMDLANRVMADYILT